MKAVEKSLPSENSHLRGVGGWLGFLVLGLLVLGPLMGYSRLIGEESEAIARYPELVANTTFQEFNSLVWMSYKIGCVSSLAAGFLLWKLRTKRTVLNAIAIMWGSLLITASVDAYAINMLPADPAWGAWIGSLLGGFIVLCGWTAYLLRSKRVKNTYVL